jgi:hypothetical protein
MFAETIPEMERLVNIFRGVDMGMIGPRIGTVMG